MFNIIFAIILLNLFIAIILEGSQKSQIETKMDFYEESIVSFKKFWQKYDMEATGMIPFSKLEELIMDITLHES